MRTDTETRSVAGKDTLLIRRTRIGSCAVLTLDEAVVAFTEEAGWTATGVRVEADQVSRAVVSYSTFSNGEANLVRIAFISGRTVTGCLMIFRFANGILSTFTLQLEIGSCAWVITLAIARITFLAGCAVMI